MHINATDHVETDILRPLVRHKWGQSHTHSTTNERGSPKITTLLEPGATSDFMSAAARLIYSRSTPLDSHHSPGNTSLTPTLPSQYVPLALSVEHLHHPRHTSHIYRPNSTPKLLGQHIVLSVADKRGQTRDSNQTTP